MKNILICLILVGCSLASLATPDPRKKNLKKVRISGKTVSLPLPPKNRR